MAFNWDKLAKAQRDYPKPKFALSYIDKLLKKNPGNPYLTTWRADVSLQLQSQPETVAKSLQGVCQHKATLQDEQLLEYAYRLIVQATLRTNPKLGHVSSVGNEGIKAWQGAASLKTTKKDRKDVWDALFTTAMRQGCWEDVRTAIVKYRAEGPSSDKLTYYTQIFAQQMSAEQKIRASKTTDVADRMAEIQLGVALKQMKDAYERPESDPISVKDIRDLRFMAKIYSRQGKCAELLDLWKAPPSHLQPIMEKHALDISLLTVDVLASAEQSSLLEKHVVGLIEDAITAMNKGESEPLRQLCSARVNIWTHLINASTKLYSPEESKNKISSIKDRIFGVETLELDRPLFLVHLTLRIYLGESLLDDCKAYWKRFSRIPSCFTDLCRAVEHMDTEQRSIFLTYIEEDMVATKPTAEDVQAKLEDWARAEICVLKFTYLITVSLSASESLTEPLVGLVQRAAKISQMLPKDPDPIMLMAYCLTNLHSQSGQEGNNSRLLLQAAMLVRGAVERDTEKENRTLCLLATRLHLNLGLGRAAFQLWKHVKVKEMLVDTLSPYLLSQIAQTHPFDVKHHQGFSADKELKHVIDTIDRMTRVQEGLIFRDIKRFHWDSAMDLISMNEKLTSSVTRHASVLERRRIARLKGEAAGDLPDVNYRDTQTLSDNIDRDVFPKYEHSSVHRPYTFLMPADIPSATHLLTQSHDIENVQKILYRDGLPISWNPAAIQPANPSTQEPLYTTFWHPISLLLYSAQHPESKPDSNLFSTLSTNLKSLRQQQESLAAAALQSTNDETPLLSASHLKTSHAALEVLRALPRLTAEIRDKIIQAKSPHPLKSSIPKDWAKDVEGDAKAAFEAVGKVAGGYIAALQKRGVAAIKAQVKGGETGRAIEEQGLLGDGDVEFWAREWVDCAVEGWRGVEGVRIK